MSMHDQDSTQTMDKIAALFFQKLSGHIDAESEQLLNEWLLTQTPESRLFYEKMTDPKSIEAALRIFYSYDEEAALKDVLNKIGEDSHETQISPLITSMKNREWWYRFAAAAAIGILIACIATLWLMNDKTEKRPGLSQTAPYKSEAVPGSDKAILELDGGHSILLDTASGELAEQAGTRIQKNADGMISYNALKPRKDSVLVYNKIITPRGGQYQVTLPDGSKVWLNAASSLRFPVAFSGHDRVVELTGEAYFEIAQNASKPFRVNVQGIDQSMDIDVLGTSFNIQAYADEPVHATTLVNGKVKVSAGRSQQILQPGQQARWQNQDLFITAANTDEVLAWKNGIIYMEDASIQSIMRQIARWYDVEIVYEGNISQVFAGKIPRSMKLSDVLRALESTGWVHFRFEGRTVTVFP